MLANRTAGRQDKASGAYQDDFEEHLLVDLHKPLVPFLDIGRPFARIRFVVIWGRGVAFVMLTPLDHFCENGLVNLGTVSKPRAC
jgi:hypothetical protein